MIQLKDITCGYGKKSVLSNININIEEGKLTCFLGKNGAGKTTLLKTILKLISPIHGEIFFDNKPLTYYSHKEFAKVISYVPQAHGTPFPFSVFDVVMMGQHAHSDGVFSIPQKENQERTISCIKALGIEKLSAMQFSKLSGGEKQMVLIARAIAQQPRFIVMDEPTSNLDIGNQITVMQTAEKLKKQGFGVLINTHSPELAMGYADYVIFLKNGRVLESGHPTEVMNSKIISETYDTNVEVFNIQKSNGATRRVCIPF